MLYSFNFYGYYTGKCVNIEEDEDWGPTIFDESKEEELIDDV